MLEVFDKIGQKVYVSYVPDCGYNVGGLYCEVYFDKNGDHKIDDFCVHPDDIPHYDNYNYDEKEMLMTEYILDYYKNEILDLNFNFEYYLRR